MFDVLNKLNNILFRYIDILKVHKWFWKKSAGDYQTFRKKLLYSNILLIIIYFLSIYSMIIIILLFFIPELSQYVIWLILFLLASVYLVFATLIFKKRGFYSSYQLMMFNFNQIQESKKNIEINNAIFGLSYEIDKNSKNASRRISLFNIFIGELVAPEVSGGRNITLIKKFFNDIATIFKKGDMDKLLEKIIHLNNYIKNDYEYRNKQKYIEGIANIKPEDNLFSYLNKVYEYLHKDRWYKRLLLGADKFLEKLSKHLTVLIFITLIILLIFFPEIFSIVAQAISKLF